MKAIILGALLLASAAHAECLDDAARTRAAHLLASARQAVTFCERCGDVAPGEPFAPQRLTTESLDLATTYIATSTHRFENLAALVGCPERGTSPTLRVDDATATGVLIVPDSAPVSRPEPVAEPAPAAAVVPVPSFTVIDHSETSLWPLVLAGSSGVLAAAGALALAARARRRRALRPRAADLVARE